MDRSVKAQHTEAIDNGGEGLVQDFCRSFPESLIEHNLEFEVNGAWESARELVSIADGSGFVVERAEFQLDVDRSWLKLQLAGQGKLDLSLIRGRISACSNAILRQWNSIVRFGRNDRQ